MTAWRVRYGWRTENGEWYHTDTDVPVDRDWSFESWIPDCPLSRRLFPLDEARVVEGL